MFIKIIKWIAGIFFLIEFIGFLIMLCTNYKTQFFPWLFGTILFGMLTYICFKKPKKKQIKESNTIEKINYSTQFPTETLQDIKKILSKAKHSCFNKSNKGITLFGRNNYKY